MKTKNKKSFPVSYWDWIFRIIAGVSIVFLFIRQIWWMIFGRLNVDEFENLQVIWLAVNGWFPGQDYLHSHLPVYNILLYPVYQLFGPSIHLPGIVRALLFPFVVILIFQIVWLARQASGSYRAAAAAVIFLFSSPLLANCIAEARPDTIGWPLALGALMLAVGNLSASPISNRRYYASALLLGAALLFTHKIVFFIPIIAWIYERRFLATEPTYSVSARVRRLILWGTVTLLSMVLVVISMIAFFKMDRTDLSMLLGAGLYETLPENARKFRSMLLRAILAQVFLPLLLFLWASVRMKWRQWPKKSGSFILWALVILALVHVVQLSIQKVLVVQVMILPILLGSLVAAVIVSKLDALPASFILLATLLLPLIWPIS